MSRVRMLIAMGFASALLISGCKKAEDGEEGAKEAPAKTTQAPPDTAKAMPDKMPEDKPDKKLDDDGRAELKEKAKNAIPTVDDGRNDAAKKADGAAGEGAAKAAAGYKKTLASTDTYELSIQVPAASPGKAAKATLTLVPKTGWKLNKEFPTKLTVAPPSGVTVAKGTQKIGDAVSWHEKKGATWAVEFTAAAAGEANFSGKFKFAVCTDATCDPKKEQLAFAVAVK